MSSPLQRLCGFGLGFFLALHQVFAAPKDDVGFTQLSQELGQNLPTASQIVVTQVEAAQAGHYLPDQTNGQFSGKSFIIKSGSSGVSGHATTVGQFFYGNSSSLSPGISTIDCYEASNWVGAGFLRAGSGAAPLSEARDVQNHSWIGSTDTVAQAAEVLQRFDYTVQENDYVAVAGLNNGNGNVPQLMASAYNVIAVGLTNGNHSWGTTTVDGSGRVKPDIVAPMTVTSNATPLVGSAAALLLGKAASDSALGDARRAQTVKALLLAGATKEEFSDWDRMTTRPLDEKYGAGELNIYNSYHVLVAGKQPASNSALVQARGWDFNTTNSGGRYYFFDVPAGSKLSRLSVILTWHRKVEDTQPGPGFNASASLANLSMKLFSASGFTPGALLDSSLSSVDNVEHIYQTNLPAGRYVLEVTGSETNVDYALAWDGKISLLTTVTIAATDNSAGELGPDNGQFTITRSGGDMNEAVTVKLTISGSATNGSDYQSIASSIVIPANASSAPLTITPIPDSEIEGQETVTLTIVADPLYIVGSPSNASVVINDMPIDQWKKDKFLAGELNNPAIVGDAADPDADGIPNISEFLFLLEPKIADAPDYPQIDVDTGFLRMTYKTAKAAAGIVHTPRISRDLMQSWQSGAENVTHQKVGEDGTFETWEAVSTQPVNGVTVEALRLLLHRAP